MSKVQPKTEKKKELYKSTNWGSYNNSLKQRGNIHLWMDEESIKNWYDDGPAQQGGQYYYSDMCIECLMGIKCVFKLPFRQLQGFAELSLIHI